MMTELDDGHRQRAGERAVPTGGLGGRVAVVTGAAGGIGAAVVGALVRSGASVAALDLDMEGLDRLTGTPTATVLPLRADVRDAERVEAALDETERLLGPVHMLVNVAGVLRTGSVMDLSDDDWATVLDVNLGGVFVVSRAVARRLVPRRAGAIVTVGSNAGRVPRVGMGAYAASKAAVSMFTRCLGLELAGHGIRCNVVAPGSTLTDMQRSLWTSGVGAEQVLTGSLAGYRTGIPLQRIATPQDVADAVVFLLSDGARHITLQELVVDGGAVLGA